MSTYSNFFSRCCRLGVLMVLIVCSYSVNAQETADKIVAIIGRNRIILQSDIEQQAQQARQQDPRFNDSSKCFLLQQMILQKLLLEQAERDSVSVTDEDVEGQLENRLRYFINMYGSKEKLEQISGKTIYQIKEENRDAIREQMVAEKVQGTILEGVKITPAEVEAFYKKIPVDSLPYFPATVEVGQIVIDPPVSQEMNDYARAKLEGIRKEIVEDGKSFETMAGIYSQDPGSRDNGGRYDGVTRTGPWAAEFVAAVFKLQNGEVSPIVKTKFGYHIIQMIQRKGDEADIRHILIRPELTTGDFQKSLHTLDSVRTLLVSGKMSFQEAVGKFSTDEAAKRTGGMIADPSTGVTELDMTKLDAGMVLMLDTLKQGDYSAPHIFLTDQHEQSCRIVYLKGRTVPHKANLKDDYSRIQEVAIAQKKTKRMQQWVANKLPSYYLKIAPEYDFCGVLNEWRASTESAAK
jgi:peptidyl-prolyl cis-trans isomerase SurA